MITTEGVELPEGTIAYVQDSYEYLGVLQEKRNCIARKSATTRYLQGVRQVLKSQLNEKNKCQAINTYALPVNRYPTGTITWPKEEIDGTDIKTRKLLTMQREFHPNFSIL